MKDQSEIGTQELLAGSNDETLLMPGADEVEKKPQPSTRSNEFIPQIILATMAVFLLYVIGSLYYSELVEIYGTNIKPAILEYWLNVSAVLIVIVIGFNLYLIRGYRRLYFGLGEIVVGLVVAWYSATIARDVSIRDGLFLGLAALYLTGSGFRNLSKIVKVFRVESEDK